MPPILDFKEISKGIDPIASITANKVKLTVRNCCRSNFVSECFGKNRTSF
jgi:hypothetical protein